MRKKFRFERFEKQFVQVRPEKSRMPVSVEKYCEVVEFEEMYNRVSPA